MSFSFSKQKRKFVVGILSTGNFILIIIIYLVNFQRDHFNNQIKISSLLVNPHHSSSSNTLDKKHLISPLRFSLIHVQNNKYSHLIGLTRTKYSHLMFTFSISSGIHSGDNGDASIPTFSNISINSDLVFISISMKTIVH